ncbi:MAG: class I SAM-dependent methyltransferase family protein, partial [Candidatus Diapherotrites archaeon]|nr:class I SAM-dependent methyltransferase family protein [Candidatus Diapherotrites archaeon]
MLGIKTELKQAENVRRYLITNNLLDLAKTTYKTQETIIFPVTELVTPADIEALKKLNAEVIKHEFKTRERHYKNIKDYLENKLSEKEFEKLNRAFDVIGDVAIIEIPYELEPKAKVIGQAILDVHSNIRIVCKKEGEHKGEFRVQDLKVIAARDKNDTTLETEYVEHGVRLRMNVATTYFSPRLSQERLRIAQQVKPGETVGAFFAGVGPFPLVIVKQQPQVGKVYAVELNPDSYKYLEENVLLNHQAEKIHAIHGDVAKIAITTLKSKCDRVVMALPKGGETFLDPCIQALKPSGILHFYQFEPEEDLYTQPIKKITEAANKLGRKVKIMSKKKVRAHAPHVY